MTRGAAVGLASVTLCALSVPAAWGASSRCAFAFVEVAAESGIDFVHDNGARGKRHLPETMGSGVAWLDFDGDGWLDLFFVQSGELEPVGVAGEHVLYRNLGNSVGVRRFERVSAKLSAGGYGQGALVGDLDGDGDRDLVITNYAQDTVLLNLGDGSFSVESLPESNSWSSSAALADSDSDGDLDLYVTHYLDYRLDHGLSCGSETKNPGASATTRQDPQYCDPSLFDGLPDALYLNRSIQRGGRALPPLATPDALFSRSEPDALSGRELSGGEPGKGLGVVWVDLDGDARPDLYVANDITPNRLLRNRGGGQYDDLSLLSGAAVNLEGKAEAGMGVVATDADSDGDLDLAVTNFDVETNTLYLNEGDLFFDDASARSGFGIPSFNLLGFGLVAGDFDLDGDQDFYVANGHIFEAPKRDNVRYRQPDLWLEGNGSGRFSARPCSVPTNRVEVGRGAAGADYDADGDLDLVVSNSNSRPFLLENRLVERHWLGVELVGRGLNTEAIGAGVSLRQGELLQHRWVIAGSSYQSSQDRRLLFSLADPSTEASVVLEIRWPSGKKQRVMVGERNLYLRIVESA